MDIQKTTPERLKNSAFKQNDGMNNQDTPVVHVGEQGHGVKRVNVEAYENDVPAYWRRHEKTLWIVVILLGIYFMAVILA